MDPSDLLGPTWEFKIVCSQVRLTPLFLFRPEFPRWNGGEKRTRGTREHATEILLAMRAARASTACAPIRSKAPRAFRRLWSLPPPPAPSTRWSL